MYVSVGTRTRGRRKNGLEACPAHVVGDKHCIRHALDAGNVHRCGQCFLLLNMSKWVFLSSLCRVYRLLSACRVVVSFLILRQLEVEAPVGQVLPKPGERGQRQYQVGVAFVSCCALLCCATFELYAWYVNTAYKTVMYVHTARSTLHFTSSAPTIEFTTFQAQVVFKLRTFILFWRLATVLAVQYRGSITCH